MKALITGASGFVGSHLVRYLRENRDYDLIGTRHKTPVSTDIDVWQIDLRDAEQVHTMISEIQPDLIFHLAAQAFVPPSFDDPWHTLENNIRGQLNIFQALVKLKLKCRMLVAASAHVYGTIRTEENPVTEKRSFRPDNPYSVSKVVQDMLAMQYQLSHRLHIIRARAFNHVGTGQDSRFVLANFAMQIAAAEAGESDRVIHVGNLDAERDFTDVRDVVRAYDLLILKGRNGEAYNICSGKAYALGDLFERLRALSTAELKIEVDDDRLRSSDIQRVVGDNRKLREDTGWEPEIDMQQSLVDILNHARQTRKQHST